ncbi:hypothetical protein CsatB_014513 [Cannabis sativa]
MANKATLAPPFILHFRFVCSPFLNLSSNSSYDSYKDKFSQGYLYLDCYFN